MRDFILLHVNGAEHRVTGDDALAPLSTYLRGALGLVGTKVVCAEGDCGACTVLLGRPREGRIEYDAVNACVLFVHQADGAHVVTVEGLADGGELSAVQRAIVDGHGVQCGFCTPGFALALTAMFDASHREEPARSSTFNRRELQRGLCGNLCRCTGYLQLLEAGASLAPACVAPLCDRYSDAPLIEALAPAAGDEVRMEGIGARGRRLYMPASLEAAVALRAEHAGSTLVSGATDVGVECNLDRCDPDIVISLCKIPGISEVEVVDGALLAGARATCTQLASAFSEFLPGCGDLLERFGSPQIRNVGTIAGNLANASPIGDFAPLLLALDAEIELLGLGGVRRVRLDDFFLGYKRTALGDDEIITRVVIPLPAAGQRVRFYKVSKRRHLDLSIVNAGILVDRDEGGRVTCARVAVGGVGPTVGRLRKTESHLEGRPFGLETFREAGSILRSEIHPISDVRGSAAYRLQLAESMLVRFYREVTRDDLPRSEEA